MNTANFFYYRASAERGGAVHYSNTPGLGSQSSTQLPSRSTIHANRPALSSCSSRTTSTPAALSCESIATHGDGSVGVQVSKPLPTLEISGDLTTEGGEGQSLVKGVQVSLKAIALSIKPGADVGTITVGGQVRTSGDNVITVEIDGNVGQVEIAGGVVAEGNDSDAIHTRGMVSGLTDVSIKTAKGQDIVQTP